MAFVCNRCHRDVEIPGLFCPFCGASAPQPDAEPTDPYIGKTIAEKYFVNQLLGRGGMGQVYKATHVTLDRAVALKMLSKSFLSDASMVQRFHREARAASRLNHPNCINILDFGETEDGALFIAMEYLPGRSLAKLLADEFPLGELRVVRIVGQILGALAEAHAAGIVHRDLKLSNVMVEARRDEPDFVKVLDFGIAKLSEAGGGAQLTGTGIVCGTPGYMSPEQARGEELDARSDLYAVGVILYELLTGQLPFLSETPMGFVAKHMTEIPLPLRERCPDLCIAPALDDLVMRALAKPRDDRPASAEEMRELLYTCELSPADAQALARSPERSATVMIPAAGTPQPSSRDVGKAPAAGTGPVIRRFEHPAVRQESGRFRAPPPSPGGTVVTPAVAESPGGTVVTPAATPPPGRPRAPAPAPRTPAPPPPGRTPRPAGRTPAPRTPAPAARRTPARAEPPPEPELDEREGDGDESAEGPREAHAHPRPPARKTRGGPSRNVLIAVGAAAAVLLLAVVAYALLRSDPFAGQPVVKVEAPAAGAGEAGPRLKKVEPGAPAPVPPPVAATPPEVEKPVPLPVAVTPPVAEKPATPPVAKAAPPPAAKPASPSRGRKGSGAVEVVEGMNVLKVPAAASGQGILTVTASPWATVFLDGRELGETPREARVGEGSYRIRLAHPTLGRREVTVAVPAGGRMVYNANLSSR